MADQDEKVAAVTDDLNKLVTDDKKTEESSVNKKDVIKEKSPVNAKADKENEKPENKESDDGDEEEKDNLNACGYCKKDAPTKRCSKRHPKCIKKMFCNQTCEDQAHKKKVPVGGVKKTDGKKKKKSYTFKEPCQWAL